MRITAVRASWLRAPIPPSAVHVSDFGRNDSFNMCLVEIDTDDGITGLGEAKAAVGNLGNYAALVTLIHAELAPMLIGRDPRDVTALWETIYNGTRAHYVSAHGRTFPIVGRRGITVSALSGIDIALWDLLGKALGQPVWRLLGGRLRERIPAYASGGWAPVGGVGKQLRQYVERGHRAVKMRVGLQDRSVDDSAARAQIHQSRERLIDILREPVTQFAYPNGQPGRDYGATHVAMVKEAGFRCAVSTAPCTARPGMDRYELPRFTPWDKTGWRFAARLLAMRIRDTDEAVARAHAATSQPH